MKQIILSIAFVTTGLFAFNASAQQPAQNGKDNAPANCCQQKAQRPGGERKAPKMFNPLEGITLNAQQQAAVDALNQKYAQARKDAKKAENKDVTKAEKKERKDLRQGRQEYLKEMQKILTPEQYITFLENQALNNARPNPRMMMKMKKGKHDKMARAKGPKGERAKKAPAKEVKVQ